MDPMTPAHVIQTVQRVANSYPSNSDAYVALCIAAGCVMGMQLAGSINNVLLPDGTFPIPHTILDRLEHGDQSIDPNADPS